MVVGQGLCGRPWERWGRSGPGCWLGKGRLGKGSLSEKKLGESARQSPAVGGKARRRRGST